MSRPFKHVTREFRGESFEEIWRSIIVELHHNPEYIEKARGTEMREILNVSFELGNPYDRMVWDANRRGDYEFAMR